MQTVAKDRRSDLVEQYDNLALRLARQFRTHRECRDDLEQVARIGLIHAADRFDPSLERPFTAFARATIVGELKRHLRDCSWTMRMPRSLHDCYLVVMRARDDLTQELGRSPRISELMVRTGLSEEQVLEATEVRYPLSLDIPADSGASFEPTQDDSWTNRIEERALLASLVAPLTERQRQVIEMYFVEGLSQRRIGDRLGVSQMAVSRLLSKSLQQVRKQAEAPDPEWDGCRR